MNNLKKQIIKTISSLYFLLFSSVVFASTTINDQLGAVIGKTGTYSNGADEDSLVIAIGDGINVVLGFLGIIFIVLIIYGGFMWMTAQGNEAQVEKARKVLIRSIVGVVIILVSFILTWFVMGTLSTLVNQK